MLSTEERVFPSVKDTSLQLGARTVSYFSPFVFNLAVSESCILFAAAADEHNANSFLSALCA
jgi:hypothetical protein